MPSLASNLIRPFDHASVWSGEDMDDRTDWIFTLDGEAIDELTRAVHQLEINAPNILELSIADFPLPVLGAKLAQIRYEILHGRGFVQMRKLPVADLSLNQCALMFWGIGLHLGDAVASQNKHGHVLGHVRNLGQTVNNATERGPYSGDRIPWHVDSCDIVGLLCLKTAVRGGESSIASSGMIYNELVRTRPELVSALMQPVYRDRRDEVPAGKPPWYALPVFNHHADLLSMSIEPTYIGSVARHFEFEPNTSEQIEGVAEIQKIADRIRLDIEFEPGDIQFLNNYAIVHTRQGFEDSATVEERRHLLRLWLKNEDGRPLGDAYFDRHGDRSNTTRPGGIVGRKTVPVWTIDQA